MFSPSSQQTAFSVPDHVPSSSYSTFTGPQSVPLGGAVPEDKALVPGCKDDAASKQ